MLYFHLQWNGKGKCFPPKLHSTCACTRFSLYSNCAHHMLWLFFLVPSQPSQRGRRRTLGEVSVASDASFLTLAENKPLAVSMSAHTLSAVPSSADPSEDRSPEALEPSRSIHEAATVYRRKRLVCECSSVPQCPTVPNGDMSFRSSSCDHNSTGDCVQQPVDRMMMVTAREEAEKSLSSPRRRSKWYSDRWCETLWDVRRVIS